MEHTRPNDTERRKWVVEEWSKPHPEFEGSCWTYLCHLDGLLTFSEAVTDLSDRRSEATEQARLRLAPATTDD